MNFPKGWTTVDDGKKVEVKVETKDFLEAVDVINELAPVAERLEHHPDIHLEQWNQLRIVSWSHDVGKLTERDERLAKEVQSVLEKRELV